MPIERNVKRSYVQNRPMLLKRKDVGGTRPNLKFNKRDKNVLKVISTKSFRDSPSIRKHDRRYVKRLRKQPRYK